MKAEVEAPSLRMVFPSGLRGRFLSHDTTTRQWPRVLISLDRRGPSYLSIYVHSSPMAEGHPTDSSRRTDPPGRNAPESSVLRARFYASALSAER